jgi:hypothetical protein
VETTSHRHRIARWLKPLFRAETAAAPDRVVLRHVTINDRQSDVLTLPLDGLQLEEQTAAALGQRFEEAISEDAEGLGGMQRYLLVALEGERQVARLTLRQHGQAEPVNGEPVDSEPPTDKGLLAQLMRHNEVQAKIFAASMGEIVSSMQETINRQKAAVEQADELRLDALTLVEDLISRRHERELETHKAEDARRMKAELLSRLSVLIPVVANKLTGDTVFPETVKPIVLMLNGLMESLGPDQFEALKRVLTPEQMHVLSEIIRAHFADGDTASAPTNKRERPS